MTKKKVYQRKFKDGEHNYHLKTIKKNAVKKVISKLKPECIYDFSDYVLIVVAILALLFIIAIFKLNN